MDVNRLIDLAIEIQQIPAPTFEEQERAEFTRSLFVKENLDDVAMDSVGNVYARARGRDKTASPLIVTAHLDTVFPRETSLEVTREANKIYAPGIGDNSLGVAALFGILWSLREKNIQIERDVWFVGNVCEEGLGNLRGMTAVVDRFGANVRAYAAVEGMAYGYVYHQAVGVKRYRVLARTAGGHSWSDYGQPSAVHELAALVTQLTSLELPKSPRTTLNVGKIAGGTGVNVLASNATIELDLRSEGANELKSLVDSAEEMVSSARKNGVSMEMIEIGSRPAGSISTRHELITLALDCLREWGIEANLTSGSTDANIPLSRNIPAVTVGVTKGGNAHTIHEYIEIEPIEKGMKALTAFVERLGARFG